MKPVLFSKLNSVRTLCVEREVVVMRNQRLAMYDLQINIVGFSYVKEIQIFILIGLIFYFFQEIFTR